MFHTAGESHPLQGLHGQVIAVVGVDALIDQGQLHILQHRQALDQVVLLEDKTDLLIADQAEFLVRQLPDVGAVQEVVSPGGNIQTAQHVHHGGFSGAGLAHNGQKLPRVHRQGHPVQGADLALQALAVDLIDVPQFYQMCHDDRPQPTMTPPPMPYMDCIWVKTSVPSSTPERISTL